MKAKLLIFTLLFCLNSTAQQDSLFLKQFEKHFTQASSFIYTQQDSSYINFNKALKIATTQKWHDQKAILYTYLIFTSSYHYNLPIMKKNLDSLNTLLQQQKDFLQQQKVYAPSLSLYLLNIGNYYYKLSDYKRAKPYFLQLKTELKNAKKTQETIDSLESIFSFLAVIYTKEGKYELAKTYITKAVNLLEKYPSFFEDTTSKKMLLNNYLATIYKQQKKYEKAIPLLEKSVVFYQSKTTLDYNNSLLSSYQSLIKNYILANKTNLALELLKTSEKFYKKENPFYKKLQELYGDVYLKQKKYTKALQAYTLSLHYYKKYRNNKKHIDIALLYKKIAVVYKKTNSLKKAYQNIQLALLNCTTNTLIFENGNPPINNIYTSYETLEVIQEKTIILQKLYQKYKDNKHLISAIKTNTLAIAIIDCIKPKLEHKNDKQYLLNKIYPIYETGLQSNYIAYTNTKDKKYLTNAFTLLEKSKATQLLEAVNQSKAIQFKNIPQYIIDKEQQLLANLNSLETSFFLHKNFQKKLELNIAKETYFNFLDSIQYNYPKYHKLKYNYTTISLQNVVKSTKPNEAKIAFFYGKKYIYQFIITKNNIQFNSIENTKKLQEELLNFYTIISNSKKQYNNNLGYNLYKKLLPNFNTKVKNIRILPDGFLHYIPFETLNTQGNSTNYLIQNTTVSYAQSFTLLQEQRTRNYQHNTQKILAIAPEFYKTKTPASNSRADFSPLVFNKLEVQNIATIFPADTLIGTEAVLQKAKEKFSNYPLLHFATHATANDEFPDFSYLAFTPVQKQQNLLYIKDIYNTNLKANLVTLSACQTGIGKLEKGEGSISLARAFSYAGANALVKSLWKVDDKSSAKLMQYFYQQLYQGKNKAIALQKAKNNYLNKVPKQLKHPFFWAGFVINGNTKAIKKTSNNYLYFGIGISLLVFVFFFLKKIKE